MPHAHWLSQTPLPLYFDNLDGLDANSSKRVALEGVIPYTPRSAAVDKVYKSKGKLLVSTTDTSEHEPVLTVL